MLNKLGPVYIVVNVVDWFGRAKAELNKERRV